MVTPDPRRGDEPGDPDITPGQPKPAPGEDTDSPQPAGGEPQRGNPPG